MLETLTISNDCQFIYRKHKNGENINGEPNPCLQTTPTYGSTWGREVDGDEKLIKQSVSQTLSIVQNPEVKLLTVSYPETFSKTENLIVHDKSVINRGERLQKQIRVKTTETLWVVSLYLHGKSKK